MPSVNDYWAKRRDDPEVQSQRYRDAVDAVGLDLLVPSQADRLGRIGRHGRVNEIPVFCKTCGPKESTGRIYNPADEEGRRLDCGPIAIGSISYNPLSDPAAAMRAADVKATSGLSGKALAIVILGEPDTPAEVPLHCRRCGPGSIPATQLLTALANRKAKVAHKHTC